ncbi:hypothetical protein LCGC14_2128930, partial [marine sediment metagenome]
VWDALKNRKKQVIIEADQEKDSAASRIIEDVAEVFTKKPSAFQLKKAKDLIKKGFNSEL